MDNNNIKTVAQFPLTNLWKEHSVVSTVREMNLTSNQIHEMIKYPIEFVVADVGKKLEWISHDKSFDFWKTEIKPHLINNINYINLDNFPGSYAYVASKWSGDIPNPIILFEKYH